MAKSAAACASFGLTVLCVFAGYGQSQSLVGHKPVSAAGEMRFFVGSTDKGMLADVEVLLMNTSGRLVAVGRTDGFGAILVPKARLGGASAVLFCKPEHYFCGAFRLDERASSAPGFLEYDEHFIQLAPLALR